jgi:hypothetical protein
MDIAKLTSGTNAKLLAITKAAAAKAMAAEKFKKEFVANISDEKWRQLKCLSGLPDEARSDVEQILRFLRERPSLKHPLATEAQVSRRNMRQAIRGFDCALEGVDALIGCGAHLVYRPLQTGPHNDFCALGVQDKIVVLRKQMSDVLNDVRYSERRLPGTRPGHPGGHLREAVTILNHILIERTGRGLDQKKRGADGVSLLEFALETFRIVEPKITIGRIQNLVKREQARRRHGGHPRKAKR